MAAAHERNHGKNSCLRIITFEAGHKCRSEIQLRTMTVVKKIRPSSFRLVTRKLPTSINGEQRELI